MKMTPPAFPMIPEKLMRFFFVHLVLLTILFLPGALYAGRNRLIIWSIDGFAAGYFSRPEFQNSAVWQRLLKQARVFRPVETTIPAVTYPAHTSMVTGNHVARHRIHSNHPVDPWGLSKDGWTWFAEDIGAPTLWDIAARKGKTVANLQWPVTMISGSKIRYHIPQFDRSKGPEEQKLMRVLSTPGLHREIEQHTGVSLTEYSGDDERIKAARYLWKKKSPDLMLLYNPGLDSIEHAHGAYSPAAFRHLELLGREMEKFLAEIRKSSPHDRVRVLVVSDHGFMTYKGKCYPNSILRSMGYIDSESRSWDYIFDTAGGVARLVGKPGAAPFAARAFADKISQVCPGIELIGEKDEDFPRLREEYSATAQAFLVSRGNVLISASLKKEEFDAKATGHTHGFLPDRSDMHTVALLFGPERGKAGKMTHVKDTFAQACSWLRLPCSTARQPRKKR